MTWSHFTKRHFNTFYNNKYNLDNNNKLIKLLRDERNNINEFINNNDLNIDIQIIPEINIDNKIKKYSNVFWVQDNLIDNINDLKINCLITWSSIKNKKQINNLYIKTNRKVLLNIVKRIKKMLYLFEYLKEKTNNHRKIDIYLVLSSLEKQYPIDNSIIDVPHVNSGYTDLSKDYIFIWRLEEFEKVLIHEIIHFLDMENRDHFNDSHKIKNIIGDPAFHEAFTDFWGILYHLIYINIITNVSLKLLFEIELAFIKNQAIQMNNYLGLGSWEQFPKIKVKQKTHAFSYYIVKYLVFEYLLNNDIDDNYQNIIIKSLNNRFINQNNININSSRMTLLQLY